MRCIFYIIVSLFISVTAFANQKVVNVYAWIGEIPDSVIRQYEQETGIKINFTGVHNNEIMFSKLRATKNANYDIVTPTGYFVQRMSRLHMLEPLDKSKLPNLKNLNPEFRHPAYDKQLQYGIPNVWGVTGIFYNEKFFPQHSINKWSDLLDSRYKNQVLLMDDIRDVFAMSLISLGHSANDDNPTHIKEAFTHLKQHIVNIKVYSGEATTSNIVDEDATLGMAWNGETYKAQRENPHIRFVYPQDGFVIWVDNLSIPKRAKHKEEAYQFINFILRPDIAKTIALYSHYPTANLAGQQLLPAEMRNNPVIYPSRKILQRFIR